MFVSCIPDPGIGTGLSRTIPVNNQRDIINRPWKDQLQTGVKCKTKGK